MRNNGAQEYNFKLLYREFNLCLGFCMYQLLSHNIPNHLVIAYNRTNLKFTFSHNMINTHK
jgi:hypothetical protein